MIQAQGAREASLEDLDVFDEIEGLSFPTRWSRKALAYELSENPLSRSFIWQENDEVLAFSIFRLVMDEAELMQVAVAPKARCKKIGYKLLDFAIERLAAEGIQRVVLEVRETNLPAQALYKSLGFTQCGCVRGYYQDSGEDAWIMERRILDKLSNTSLY